MSKNSHPAQRFIEPSSIQTGVRLKELMGGKLIGLIGESLAEVMPSFDIRRFRARASRGLDKLELKERALNIAHAMAEQMPADFSELAPLLMKSLGPTLPATDGNGLAPFFYFPHTAFDRRLRRGPLRQRHGGELRDHEAVHGRIQHSAVPYPTSFAVLQVIETLGERL